MSTMITQTVLEPLDAAGLHAVLRADGRVLIGPPDRLTDEARAFIKDHRDQIVAALSAVPAPARRLLDWPPPPRPHWGPWMAEDDGRRAHLMRAAKARLARR